MSQVRRGPPDRAGRHWENVGVSLRGLRDQFPSNLSGAPVRRRARVDANHVEVRSALRAAGWTVVDCARIGSGFPDLLIARRGTIRMVEIKDGAKVKSKQQLTEDEVQFHALMAAAGVTVSVVTSVEEALAL